MGNYLLRASRLETPSILTIVLASEKNDRPFSFQPGQYAGISFNKNGRWSAVRCFSIASTPTDLNHLEFGIRLQGKYTRALQNLTEGTRFKIQGPYGSFVTSTREEKTIVMLAGGIGITPFMSMMRHAKHSEDQKKYLLFFGVRNQDDIPYINELYELANTNKNLHIYLVIDSGPTNKIQEPLYTLSGRIDANTIHRYVGETFLNTAYFICGPPPFMKGIESSLVSNGVPGSKIITEAFSQGHDKQTDRSRNWPLNIYVLGAVGVVACAILVSVSDMLKNIPSTLLPETLGANSSSRNRSTDLDAMIQSLELQTRKEKSPSVIAANQEVSDALREIEKSQTSNNLTPAPQPTPSPVPQPVPAPQPTPSPVPQPVCTTSASGVTVCN